MSTAHTATPGAASLDGARRGSLRVFLRAATRAEHEAIDARMSRFDLARAQDYGAFLNVHRSALQHLEADWRDADREDFRAMVRCAEDDMNALGVSVPPVQAPMRPSLSGGGRLGLAYVIRGSRLGSAVLRRRVPPSFPAAYLGFVPSVSWAQFLQELDDPAARGDLAPTSDVAVGARLAFKAFADFSGRGILGSE